MILACWQPQRCPHRCSVQAVTCSKVIYLSELPWGSACSCCVPVHFWLANQQLNVEPPYICSPRPSHVKVQHAVKEICHPSELPWGLACSSHLAPVHFPPSTVLSSSLELLFTCWAQSCCCMRWRSLSSSQWQSPNHLSAHIRIIYAKSPTCYAVHVGGKNEVIAGCSTALLTPIHFHCWESIEKIQLLRIALSVFILEDRKLHTKLNMPCSRGTREC